MWQWELVDGEMVVYDHTGSEVARNSQMDRFSNKDVKDIMQAEAMAEYQANGFNNRVFAILRDAIFEQIERIE